jgi:hypothetical protein
LHMRSTSLTSRGVSSSRAGDVCKKAAFFGVFTMFCPEPVLVK